MKKLLVAFVLVVLLFAVTPVFAGNFDGVWVITNSDQSISLAMVRESSGALLLTSLDPEMNDWQAFYGTVDGTTAHLTTLVTRWEKLGITITLLSSNSASGTITSCTSTVSTKCESGTVGSTFTLQKIF